jgi:hypothetical protein
LVTAVNYLQVAGSLATNAPILSSQGSDTNISMAFQPKGTGAIDLAAGSSGVNISNGGTVTAITRTAVGVNYTTNPSVVISAPTTAGGVQATATVPIGVASFTVSNGGTGYTVGDVLTMVGGTFTAAGTCTVATVSSGVITAVTATSTGTYTAAPTNPASVTGGTGTSATFTLIFGVLSTFTITAAGSGYIEQPTVTFSGGGGSGAAAYATVGSIPTVKSLGSAVSFYTANGEQVRISGSGGTTTDYVELNGGISGTTNGVYVKASGASTNQALYLQAKGTSSISFYTNWLLGVAEQMRIAHTASAVNYVQVTGSATGGRPVIQVAGSDTNIGISYTAKGTGIHAFGNGNGTQLVLQAGSTSSVNRLEVTPAVTGSAPILAAGGRHRPSTNT